VRTVGVITAAAIAAAAVGAAVVGVRSIPDFKRYLKMRSM